MENAERDQNRNIGNVFWGALGVFFIIYYITSKFTTTTPIELIEIAPAIEIIAPIIQLEDELPAIVVVPKIKKIIIIQPTSHISYMHTNLLQEILLDLYVISMQCTPADFHDEEKHKIPISASKTIKMSEPRAAMVVYIAMGMLFMSLGAALLDFFRAKSEMKSPKNGKKKPSLTRRCSLADLTLLRHARKENMRKDSIYEGNTGAPGKSAGRKVSRPPLRLE